MLTIRATFAAAACLAATATVAEPFTFVALGDAPYGEPAEAYPTYEALIGAINALAPSLVIHVGDIKSGSTPCSDELIDAQLDYLNSVAAPVLYTPGDNEWTDCHRPAAGGFDPLERLAHLRATFFAEPKTLGAVRMPVETQRFAGYPENARLMMNDVMFVTAHVVGSNNNFETRDMAAIEEFMFRDTANLQWLQDSFAAATDAKALVIAIQADMFEFDFNPSDGSFLRHSGFDRFGAALVEAAAAFGRPVLLVYGDSHVFRQMRPFPDAAPNLLSIEVPGAERMHAVEITADPATSGVFSATMIRNPALTE